MGPEGREAVLAACGGDGRYVRLALEEAGLRYVEDFPDLGFLVARIRALREEDILTRLEDN